MRYTTVFFDFGGVFTASPFDAVSRFAENQGVDPGHFSATVFGQYGVDGDHPWHRMERGEISLEQTRSEIIALGEGRGFKADIYDVFASMGSDGGVNSALSDYCLKLRPAGITTVCVTNNVKEFGDGWRSLIPTDDIFDHIVDSSAVGVRKPEAEIFHIALEQAGADAGQVLFLDDFQGNFDAAQALGIDGILVTPDQHRTISDLQAALGIS